MFVSSSVLVAFGASVQRTALLLWMWRNVCFFFFQRKTSEDVHALMSSVETGFGENDHQPCVARVCRNQANDSNVCYKFSGQKKTYQGGQISDSSKIQVVKSDVTEMLLYFENDKVLTYFAFPVNKNRWTFFALHIFREKLRKFLRISHDADSRSTIN